MEAPQADEGRLQRTCGHCPYARVDPGRIIAPEPGPVLGVPLVHQAGDHVHILGGHFDPLDTHHPGGRSPAWHVDLPIAGTMAQTEPQCLSGYEAARLCHTKARASRLAGGSSPARAGQAIHHRPFTHLSRGRNQPGGASPRQRRDVGYWYSQNANLSRKAMGSACERAPCRGATSGC